MNNNNITCFTHNDLDGVVSYLVLCWALGFKPKYVPTTPMRLVSDWTKWSENNNSSAEIIFFTDLDVSRLGDQIDKSNVTIFDHHKTNIFPFKHAKTFINEETSCAKLLFNRLIKSKEKNISEQQKLLIALADDWDSNTKNSPLSEELNIVYHSMSKKFDSFVEDYYKGFKPFDKFKKNTIFLYKKHRDEYLSQLKPFFGEVIIGEKESTVGAVFCEKFVHESCDLLLKNYGVDVAIAVILSQKRIAVRRNSKNTEIDVSKFVQRIASGGGHEAAAGGNLTDEFIEFTKMLKPIEEPTK